MIRELRMSLGMSQNKLAKLAGVRQSVISYIESGKTKNPRSDTLAAIAAVFGVTIEDLLKKAG